MYDFECPLCHYSACVSGGADEGINCATHTIVCRNCRRLFEVITRIRMRDNPSQPINAGNRMLSETEIVIPPLMLVENPLRNIPAETRPPLTPTRWEEISLACPVSKSHHVEAWNEPGRCPRCGNYMEKNGFPYRVWE
jgi:hypothetical protein